VRFALACLPPPDRPIFLYALIACAMHTELTFIILAAPSLNRSGDLDRNSSDGADIQWEAVRALPMAGDVNLFMKGSRDEDDFEAEVEIMIAGACIRHRMSTTTLTLARLDARRERISQTWFRFVRAATHAFLCDLVDIAVATAYFSRQTGRSHRREEHTEYTTVREAGVWDYQEGRSVW